MPFRIVRNDITKMKADAIVNSANPKPVCGGGAELAVYQAAGAEKLLARRRKIGDIEPGQAAVTPAFALDAKYIIHTVAPLWQGGGRGEAECVRKCYENSLRLARRYKCRSVAFPLLASGAYGYPKGEALQIALSAIGAFLDSEDMTVYLVVFDQESFELSGKLFADIETYIDARYVRESVSPYRGDRLSAERELPAGAALVPRMLSAQMPSAEAEPVPRMLSAQMPSAEAEPGPRTLSARTPSAGAAQAPRMLSAQMPSAEAAQAPQARSVQASRSLDDVMAQLGETFQQRLFRLIDQRNMTDVEVYKRANLDRKLFSKIRGNAGYRPKKITALALAIALRLNLDETKDLLARAEYALSPSSRFDLIIAYFIEREVYDIYTINLALFAHGQVLLGE